MQANCFILAPLLPYSCSPLTSLTCQLPNIIITLLSRSRPVNTSYGSGTARPAGTNLQTQQTSYGAEQLCPRPQSAHSGQPLTEQNLAEHNQQQAQLMSLAGYNTNLDRVRIARLAGAGREFGITPSELREERSMQHSEAANPMEWYLAEDDRNTCARTFPRFFVHDGHRGKGDKQ
jgi:hypothetical protein